MGWASGSGILLRVWGEIRDLVPETNRVTVLANLMGIFSDEDCDTLDEVICDDWPESQPAYDLFYGED